MGRKEELTSIPVKISTRKRLLNCKRHPDLEYDYTWDGFFNALLNAVDIFKGYGYAKPEEEEEWP